MSQKKRKKTYTKKSKGVFKWLLASFGLAVLTLLFSSFLLTSIGNNLIEKDYYSQASIFYTIANLINPFNETSQKGQKIAQVIDEERKGESEETQNSTTDKAIAVTPFEEGHAVLGARTLKVPVLMYHYIRVNPIPSDTVGFNLSVTPDNFNAQMDYLASHGYHTISLDELGAGLVMGATLPDKPIVITLDDGYRDAYTAAYPILKSHNMRAVNFIITGFVGGPNYLTWDMINEMKGSGVMSYGSHTINHIALSYASSDRIKKEVTESKNTLQSHAGYTINWLAYPYGNVNATVASLTQQAGYFGALGTNNGAYESSNNMYTLPRIRIGGGDSVNSFAAKLP